MSNNTDYNQGYQDGMTNMRYKLQTMISDHLQEVVEQNEEHYESQHTTDDDVIAGWIECLEMYKLAVEKIK